MNSQNQPYKQIQIQPYQDSRRIGETADPQKNETESVVPKKSAQPEGKAQSLRRTVK
jgi:hypothetical protein